MEKEKRLNSSLSRRIRILYYYYHRKGFYSFIGFNVLKIIFFYTLFIVSLILLNKYVVDFNSIFQTIVTTFSDSAVLITFFISESILGMIPPDIFMMWATKFETPIIMLTVLGVLSYIGGIISYKIGYWITLNKRVKSFTEQKLKRYMIFTQKWGGAFIVISALFPFSPYALVILAVSILRYPFKHFLIFGLFRISRFVLQGIAFAEFLDFSKI
ncbi:MAG: short-chain dehydrogenase [Bacteroidota bacterium]